MHNDAVMEAQATTLEGAIAQLGFALEEINKDFQSRDVDGAVRAYEGIARFTGVKTA